MKDVLVTSSALILAVLLIRFLFRKSVSRRLQYALWALVLLRLLIPLNLPAVEHNVLTATRPVYDTVTAALEQEAPVVTLAPVTPGTARPADPPASPADDAPTTTQVSHSVRTADVLRIVWYGGMAAVALWFLLVNVRFAGKLRRTRVPLESAQSRYSVYLCDDIPSPCLFGLLRPAIYVTSEAARDPARLRYVIAHEETHARHLDPLWSSLRGVCLVIWWFNPLVWLAGHFSRVDCELACDEGTLARLGETERAAYGETLLALVPVKHGADPLLTATTMTAGKGQMTDRITRISQHQQPILAALLLALTLISMVCIATFTGAKAPTEANDSLLYRSATLCEEPSNEGYDVAVTFKHATGEEHQYDWDWSMAFEGVSPRTVDLAANPPRFDGDKSVWMTYDRNGEIDDCVLGRCITTQAEWDFMNRVLFSAEYESDPGAQYLWGTPCFILRQGNECTSATSQKAKEGETLYIDDTVSSYYVSSDGSVLRFDADNTAYRAKTPLDRESVAYLYLLYEAYTKTSAVCVPYWYWLSDEPYHLLIDWNGQRVEIPAESFEAFLDLITEDGNEHENSPCFDCTVELFSNADYPSKEVLRFRFVYDGYDPDSSPYLWISLRRDGKITREMPIGGGGTFPASSWWWAAGRCRMISTSRFPVDEIVAFVKANGVKS